LAIPKNLIWLRTVFSLLQLLFPIYWRQSGNKRRKDSAVVRISKRQKSGSVQLHWNRDWESGLDGFGDTERSPGSGRRPAQALDTRAYCQKTWMEIGAVSNPCAIVRTIEWKTNVFWNNPTETSSSKNHLNNSKLQFFRSFRIGSAGFLHVNGREKLFNACFLKVTKLESRNLLLNKLYRNKILKVGRSFLRKSHDNATQKDYIDQPITERELFNVHRLQL
jgi:hypothetical protein